MASVAVGGFAVDQRAASDRPRGLSTVRLLAWPSGAFRKRSFIDDHSDAIELRTPDALRRLI